jgi:hypothetical protein
MSASRAFWIGLPLACGLFSATARAGEDSPPFVIELFTSQGCASCPPADAVLSRMAKQPDVFALTFPVGYWDYMGWKDTLARPEFATLQKRYAAARGDNHVYTPQAVIDGLAHVVGSNVAEILEAARRERSQGGVLSVPVVVGRQTPGTVMVKIGAAQGTTRSGMVWLLRIAPHETVTVREGENKGRTLTYTNVVRSIRAVGNWDGSERTYEVGLPDFDGDAAAFFIFLQAGNQMKPGAILGAGKSPGL